MKSISELESKVGKCAQSEMDLRTKLEWAKREADQANNELQQYRSRAQTTLQMKDKLIEELKLGSNNGSAATQKHSIEHEQMMAVASEREAAEECRRQVAETRRYVEQLENGQREQRTEFERAIDAAIEQQRTAEMKCRQVEAEAKVQQREMTMVREEMARLQADYVAQMHKK